MNLDNYIKWLKAHERLVLLVGAGFLAFHFYDRGLDAWIRHDDRQATIAAQKVQTDETSNKLLSAQLSELRQQVANLEAQKKAEMLKRAQDTDTQKKKDDAMTSSELSVRIQTLLNVGPQEVTASPVTGELVFSPNAAHKDADELENLQACRLDVVDLNTELSSQHDLVSKQDDMIVGLNKQIVDEKDSHKKDVALERAKAKRSWVRGFKVGVIVGVVGGEAIRLFVFHKP